MLTRNVTGRKKRLVIITAMRITVLRGRELVLTNKFISGIHQYMRHWDGPICVLAEGSSQLDSNLDHVAVSGRDPRGELGFDVQTVDFNPAAIRWQLEDDDLLLASLVPNLSFVPSLRRFGNLTIVYVSEYSLRTRLQIARCDARNPLRLLKRSVFEASTEELMRRAVALSDGVQCNGTPTFDAYRGVSPDPLLFFDTRVKGGMMATEHDVVRRGAPGPIRLVYSGRLIPIKGADHLLEVARHLAAFGVVFELTVYGGGNLVPEMRRVIDSQGLAGRVKLAGVLDFETELVPAVKERADLFVCCHRQGDPSCTYLETMSCGVPIIGYDNEALRGIVGESHCGWLTPMDRPRELAMRIALLSRNRSALADHANAAIRFAKNHTFERTFERRIEHLKQIATRQLKEVV